MFPYVPRGADLDERPVDVYSPDGEQLFSGVMSGPMANLSWQTPPAYGPMLQRTGSGRLASTGVSPSASNRTMRLRSIDLAS